MRVCRSFVYIICSLFFFSNQVLAEEKLEETIPLPPKNEAAADLNQLKRARLSKDQAVNQLKYMMVKAFARVEDQIVAEGSFEPFGMTLLPDGEFKAVFAETGDVKLLPSVQLAAMAKNMEKMAKTRSVWAVGIMYIRAVKREDGTYAQRIIVMTEHIAGWAMHWAYPFKVENGKVQLAQPQESEVDPIYFVEKRR